MGTSDQRKRKPQTPQRQHRASTGRSYLFLRCTLQSLHPHQRHFLRFKPHLLTQCRDAPAMMNKDTSLPIVRGIQVHWPASLFLGLSRLGQHHPRMNLLIQNWKWMLSRVSCFWIPRIGFLQSSNPSLRNRDVVDIPTEAPFNNKSSADMTLFHPSAQ